MNITVKSSYTVNILGKLNKSEIDVLSLITFWNDPIESELLSELLSEFYRAKSISNIPTSTEIDEVLNNLLEKELIVSKNNKYNSNFDLMSLLCQKAIKENEHEAFATSINKFSSSCEYRQNIFLNSYSIRNALIELFTGVKAFPISISMSNLLNSEKQIQTPPWLYLIEPFNPELISKLPVSSQCAIFIIFHTHILVTMNDVCGDSAPDILSYYLQPKWLKEPLFLQHCAHILSEHLILMGDFERAKSYLQFSTSPERHGLQALLTYIFHGHEAALPEFKNALKIIRKESGKGKVTFHTLADTFYFISLIQDSSPDKLSDARQHLDTVEKCDMFFRQSYHVLRLLYIAKTTGKIESKHLSDHAENYNIAINSWLSLFIMHWLSSTNVDTITQVIEHLDRKARAVGFNWISSELMELKRIAGIDLKPEEEDLLKDWQKKYTIPLATRVSQKPQWEIALDAINSTFNLANAQNNNTARIIWLIDFKSKEKSCVHISALEQVILKSGKWSAGKDVTAALHQFISKYKPFPLFYTPHDQKIAQSMRNFTYSNDLSILSKMIGHPFLFFAKKRERLVELIKGEPVLLLSETQDENLSLSFYPQFSGQKTMVLQETEYRLGIYEFSDAQISVARILEEKPIFPPAALKYLKSTISALGPLMPVHTSVSGTGNLTPIASIPAHCNIYALLSPSGEGLSIKLCIKPFGKNGPGFVPVSGIPNIFSEISGQKLHTKRNFDEEKRNIEHVLENVTSLSNVENMDYQINIVNPEEALQALFELQELKNVMLEWPVNAKVKKVKKAKFSSFSFSLSSNHDWFEIEGDLKIDDETVISLRNLLKQYDGHTKFLALGNEQFLFITEEFKKKIEDLKTFTNEIDGRDLVHNSSMQLVDSILTEADNVKYDKTWHEALLKFKKAARLEIKLPSDLNGELRDYQREGYFWLARMAYLGFGACLADDMGLGKTIEALSIILLRAKIGPTFVLAPTSVCSNWYNETKRFAPTLNPILFGQSDRLITIKNLSPYDLIICSYGVLQREIELLAKINWTTLILDEAQAIKNMGTNRSHAAMMLQGKFKMLITGTPIENHLGELWNLFRFLNPSLLGSLKKFNENFADAIQNHGNKQAQERLKKLVSPFILRRTKNQVLDNLPPRTEITLQIDLSQQERALYESMRRNAVDRISCENSPNKAKPMIVLAEIMKLRRLCCNPSLVAPELNIESSKLSLLSSIADDLLENKHKALIFSQFVDHLTIVRELFEKKQINYQYLDGSTPIKAREKAISAFQSGDGDFFLISLKAGGLGLNLTAADYVIHLDPWWNPAVENQASDRAHRIGQTRPVTIYKLITTNTIEEKIVQLHGRKRDLADGLLSGSDMAGKISTTELIKLISDNSLNK